MKSTVAYLSAIAFALLISTMPGQAQALDWETHYAKAVKAYSNHNLFEARHEFLQALKVAKQCKEHQQLADKVQELASTYETQDKEALAQPLFKLARKLKSQNQTM